MIYDKLRLVLANTSA